MTFRCLIAVTLYTLLIGPVMDVPSSNAKAKSRVSRGNTTTSNSQPATLNR